MNLFFYMPRPGGREDELLSAVAPFVSRGSLEVFSDLQSFAARIRRPKDAPSIALIWNPTQEDLRQIGSMRDFLTGARILLVLADQETETIMLAHKIFPTYIAYVDDGISEIVSVLKRLTRAYKSGSGTEAERE
jgi:hypothetical protein